jgi:hypothetical protein
VIKTILNLQRPLWEGDQEVAKRSGRNKPVWVTIHKFMEAMLGISFYSYLYPKLAKQYVFLIISYIFLTKKSEKRTEQVVPGSRRWGHGVYTCR